LALPCIYPVLDPDADVRSDNPQNPILLLNRNLLPGERLRRNPKFWLDTGNEPIAVLFFSLAVISD
jgi:hypothetical protein